MSEADDPEERVIVAIQRQDGGWEDRVTGLRGHLQPGYGFVIPFQDETSVEECARIVSQALKRRGEDE